MLEGRLQFRSDHQMKELENARAERVAMTQELERAETEAGGSLRTSTRPMLNLPSSSARLYEQ